MIKVGLTGNIGSGKSTVAQMFRILGIPLHPADTIARSLLETSLVKKELLGAFGSSVFDGEGVDRKKLAAIVFHDKEALDSLNAIIHPRVRAHLEGWLDEHRHYPYVIQEAAILFESGFYSFFDRVILVSCPEEITIQRVMDRDSISREDVLVRLKNQWPEVKKIPHSDYIINNDGSELLIPQILAIHKELGE